MSIIARLRHRERETQASQDFHPAPRTIVVSARIGSRISRLRVRQPVVAAERPYDVELAAELIRNTGQVPGYKRGLILVLREYRQALYDLVSSNDAATES